MQVLKLLAKHAACRSVLLDHGSLQSALRDVVTAAEDAPDAFKASKRSYRCALSAQRTSDSSCIPATRAA